MSHRRPLTPSLAIAGAVLLCAVPAAAVMPTTTLISVDPPGTTIGEHAAEPRVSRTGRYVAFESYGAFSTGKTNRSRQIHLRDRVTDTTVRVSVSSTGEAATRSCSLGGISANGRWVVFSSLADNLVPNDTNGVEDVFVRDVVAGVTFRASVTSVGGQANGASYEPVISADGHTVAFSSTATNLVPNDDNGAVDVFVRELGTFSTSRISVTSTEAQVADGGDQPSISGDGRYVAFASSGAIDPADTNDYRDVYVRDRTDTTTTRVSHTVAGGQTQDGASYLPTISADGSVITFVSTAPNLVAVDKNNTVDAFYWVRATDKVRIISKAPGGAAPKGETWVLDVSEDGSRIAFTSDAAGFVTGDTNGVADAFVLDRSTGTVRRVSVKADGSQGAAHTNDVVISGDGHIAAIGSRSRLTAADTDARDDVFVRGPLP